MARANVFSERSSSPCCPYFCRTIHGAASRYKATEPLQIIRAKMPQRPKPCSTTSHGSTINPSTGENYENESHAIKQQTYSNRIHVRQSIEAFRVHLRGRDFAFYGNFILGSRR